MIVYVIKIRPTPIFYAIMSIVILFITVSFILRLSPTGTVVIVWIIVFILLMAMIHWVTKSIINTITFFENKDTWRIVQDSCYMLEYYDKVDRFHLIVDEIEQVVDNEYKLHSTLGEFYTKVDTPKEAKKLSKAQDLITKDGEVYIDLTRMLRLRTPLIEEVDDKRYIQHLFALRSIGFNQHLIII